MTLSQLLAERIQEQRPGGDLADYLTDKVLEQDMGWLAVEVDRANHGEAAADQHR